MSHSRGPPTVRCELDSQRPTWASAGKKRARGSPGVAQVFIDIAPECSGCFFSPNLLEFEDRDIPGVSGDGTGEPASYAVALFVIVVRMEHLIFPQARPKFSWPGPAAAKCQTPWMVGAFAMF